MARIFLQDMIKDLKFENLPPKWNSFDLINFSKSKKLWDYQQDAVKNAIKVLWKYFEDFADYRKNEELEVNQKRKEEFFKWYKDNGVEDKNLDIKLEKKDRDIYKLLEDYYPIEDKKVSYKHFINRMSFWMATGSGKSLVIIKLIQVLTELIKREEIPQYDILILTHRDDLIEQLKKQVNEFNDANETKINLKELKEYPEVKRQQFLYGITVFYYRSDNLSDEQKEKIIDYKNYDNDGKWYIFLDEAHKGDKQDSKRQHIYSILSRNGFLFNFSATFTDLRDIVTCVFEFNLSRFIDKGYGKHIYVLKQEIKAFKEKEDYNNEEKQKIVLKSLIILTYVKKLYKDIKNIRSDLYHKPLLLTLVNSVNTQDADLKLFFRELEKIGKNEIEKRIFKKAIEELLDEIRQNPEFMFEKDTKLEINEEVFKNITEEDILNYVYNSEKPGEIEIIRRKSNNKELAFKLKTSDKPFALIKIGDISGWLKSEINGYEIQERFEDESYFENLNRKDSEINILMGSRGFYEGWDSNRPNVINFINIGVGEDAKKFILQSVGRGVRIEPIEGKRKRLISLYNANEIHKDLFDKIKDKVLPIETLFIFATNRNVLTTVVQELEKEKVGKYQISLYKNYKAKEYKLLVPTYKPAQYPFLMTKKQSKFEITSEDFEMLKKFNDFVLDDRIFLMRYNTEPAKIKLLRESLNNHTQNNFKFGGKSYKNVDLLIQRFFDYLSIIPYEFEDLKELNEEIKHFENIIVYFEDISEFNLLENKINNAFRKYQDSFDELRELIEKYKQEQITSEKWTDKIIKYRDEELIIKHITNHYYLPLILSNHEKINYIKHIIKTTSEVKFINDLEQYLSRKNNKFQEFEWWMFSKIDESLDKVYIPYYNPNTNKINHFYPDFIFWFQKGDNYFIVFVDPKGTEHTQAYRKIDGYKILFEENGKEKVFKYNNFNVKIKLLLRSNDISKVPDSYKQYWFDNIEKMLEKIIQ